MKTKSEIMELVNAIPTCAFLYKFASPYGDGFVWRTDCSQWNGQKPIGWIELVDRAAIEAALDVPTVPDGWKLVLENLLCRIHRDGGHYIAEHGIEKAVENADLRVAELNAMSDAISAPEPAQAEQPYTQYPYEAALSWSGFNVFGNVASIAAVKNAIHEAGIVPELRERIKQAEQPRNEPVQQEPMPGMSAMNRTIAYCAASKLRSIGYEWDGSDWAAPQARNEAKTK